MDLKTTERVHILEQRLVQKARELSLLKEMSLFLASSVQKTLDLFAYRMNILTNAKFVRVYLVDNYFIKLRLVAGYNLSERYLEMVRDKLEVSIDAVPCGRAVKDKVPHVVSDVNVDDAFALWRDVTTMHGYSSYIAMPLMVSDRVLGAVDVFFESIRHFSDDELNLMTVLSNAGALAIENAILIEKIEHTSIVDDATGAYNYRHLNETLKKEVERSSRYNQPLTLIMMQIKDGNDYEKVSLSLTDRDSILKSFVSATRSRLRGTDMLFRYREDAFCLILPQTPKSSSAEVVMTRLYSAFTGIFGEAWDLNISIAGMPDDGKDAEALIGKLTGFMT